MNIGKTFFVQEIVRLHHNIERLGQGLNGHNPTDPRYAGQYELLHNEQQCRELLLDLAESYHDLGALQGTLHIRYQLAQKIHDRNRQDHPINGRGPRTEWWSTLGQMQYLCHLNKTLAHLIKEHPAAEVSAEVRAANNGNGTAMQRDLLDALAQAEGGFTAPKPRR